MVADTARIHVTHSSGEEFWTRVVEGYTFAELLEACARYFDTPEASQLTLTDRRTGKPLTGANLQTPVLEYFGGVHSSPDDVFLLALEDSVFEAAVAFAKDANPSVAAATINESIASPSRSTAAALSLNDVEGVCVCVCVCVLPIPMVSWCFTLGV